MDSPGHDSEPRHGRGPPQPYLSPYPPLTPSHTQARQVAQISTPTRSPRHFQASLPAQSQLAQLQSPRNPQATLPAQPQLAQLQSPGQPQTTLPAQSQLAQLPPNGDYLGHPLQDQIIMSTRASNITYREIANNWFPTKKAEWVRRRYAVLAPAPFQPSAAIGLPPDGDYAADPRKYQMVAMAREQDIRFLEIKRRWFPNTHETTLATWGNRYRNRLDQTRQAVVGQFQDGNVSNHQDQEQTIRSTRSQNIPFGETQQQWIPTQSIGGRLNEHGEFASLTEQQQSLHPLGDSQHHGDGGYQPVSGGYTDQPAHSNLHGRGGGGISPFSVTDDNPVALIRAAQHQRADNSQTAPYNPHPISPWYQGSGGFPENVNSDYRMDPTNMGYPQDAGETNIHPVLRSSHSNRFTHAEHLQNQGVSYVVPATNNNYHNQLVEMQIRQQGNTVEQRPYHTYLDYATQSQCLGDSSMHPMNENYLGFNSLRHGEGDHRYPAESRHGEARATQLSYGSNYAGQHAERRHQRFNASQGLQEGGDFGERAERRHQRFSASQGLPEGGDFGQPAERRYQRFSAFQELPESGNFENSLYPPVTGNPYNYPDPPQSREAEATQLPDGRHYFEQPADGRRQRFSAFQELPETDDDFDDYLCGPVTDSRNSSPDLMQYGEDSASQPFLNSADQSFISQRVWSAQQVPYQTGGRFQETPNDEELDHPAQSRWGY